MALSSLAAEQAKGTENTAKAIVKLLNYCATHPDAALQCKSSDMILRVHSDTSYLTEPRARSRTGGYFFLGNNKDNFINAPVLTPTGVMKVVVSSAAEAETAGLFTDMKEATALRTALEEMGHPQPPTPVQVDNSTACGIASKTIKQRQSKAIDRRFYWVQDRVNQQHFHVYWKKGLHNVYADYVTKHHPTKHHQQMRPLILHQANLTSAINGIKVLMNPTHCKGVLIPRLPNNLGTINQWDQILQQTDGRRPEHAQVSPKHDHMCKTTRDPPRVGLQRP